MSGDRNISGKIGLAVSQYAKEGEYWLSKFSDDFKKTGFPYDHSPSFRQKQEEQQKKDVVKFQFTHPCASKLVELSKGLDHRLFMILSAGLVALLHKYTGSKDITIGSPIFKQETEGDFINTVLALRIQWDHNINFRELLLNRVRQTIVEADEHQNYPIEALLHQLNMSFSQFPFPLFDVAILLENIHEKEYLRHTYPTIIFSFLRTDDVIEGVVEYHRLLYDKNTAARIAFHFKRLVEEIIFNVNVPLFEIDILGEDEKRQLLFDFNATQTSYPAKQTIDELFEEQVSRKPAETAVTYEGEPVSYKALNEEADQLAAYLCSIGIKPREPVALMAENSYRVITAVLGILKAGGAYVPLNAAYPEERKKYILNDCNVNVLLTNFREAFAGDDYDYIPHVIDLENSGIYQQKKDFHREGNSEDLAYIMYTSGSTGTPKGVMVIHRNVVRLVKNTNYVEFNEGDSILLTGALEFDASTFEIWGALLNGLQLHLVSKSSILSPHKLEKAMERDDVTTLWMTAPLFNQMVDANIMIFKGLKQLVVGGDVLSPAHINRVRHRFPGLTVVNGYGPTENTTFSITHRIEKDYEENIPIGKPINNSTTYILDNYHQPVPIGIPGELYVGGDGISRGYLNNPELTSEKFIELNRSYKSYRSYNFYRTGDLARWCEDGTIEFLGRIDHQVKIRGYRIELGEIENHLMLLDFINEAVVVDRKNKEGEKYLCAYIAAGDTQGGKSQKMDPGELKRTLLEHLPDYMVPSYFVQLDQIPLTSNGKVNRKALPEPEAAGSGAVYAAPRNEMEKTLAEIWSRILDVDKERIGIDDDFFELGGHSLRATILIAKIHKAFDARIPLAELFIMPTIRELAEFIDGLQRDKFLSIETAEEREYYELSSAQKRLYILQQMELEGTSYNVPYMVVLEGKLEMEKLEATFKKLINRHESLRTSFEMVNEKPVQKIHKEVAFELEYYDLDTEEKNGFIRPFDLSQAPLLRVGLIKEAETRYILMVDIHHIVTDGISMELLVREFLVLYTGEELPVLKVQYKDYAQWQNSEGQKEAVRQQETFWLKQFEGEIPVLDLPIDFPRPAVQSFAGSSLLFELSYEVTKRLKDLVSREGVTLYMALLAVTAVFLSKLSNQEDIVVGTPIAARRHADLERVIGMFVNTLVMRNFPLGAKNFTVFLEELKQRTLEAFENQEYQFEDLVEQVLVNRDAGRNPLFDVIFTLQNIEAQPGGIPAVEIPGFTVSPYDKKNEDGISKFDITLSAVETRDNLVFSIQYCTKLFKAQTIQRFISYYSNIVCSILENPLQKICDIEILPEEEKRHILFDFNDTGEPYANDKTIPQLFEEQVEQTPDQIALIGPVDRISMTYKKLNQTINQLTYYLHEQGIRENELVGLMVNRSIEMIIGILGILKAGCAYVPLNPKAPAARSKYILEECSSRILVSDGSEGEEVRRNVEVIDLVKIGPIGPIRPIVPEKLPTYPTQLCYVIFTSGSTGKPKGVPVTHANLCPLLHWGYRKLELGSKDRFIQNLSYYFDWSVWEIVMALTTGASLYMVPDELLLNPEACVEFMNQNKITVLHVTPTQYQYFVNVGCKLETLKYLFIGAEKLSNQLVERSFQSVNEDCRVFNMYGPTECTIISAVLEIERSDVEKFQYLSSVPIGGPVGNINLLVLDKYLNPCPVNVSGELYIGGDCVAHGYLNNPEMTANRFIGINRSYMSYIFYRTGDLVRWLSSGIIEFLGRVDFQVKIRGFRIELGEIESHIQTHDLVREAVVIDREKQDGEKYLCGYIIPKEDFDLTELKEYLSRYLPDYMIPSYFMEVESIPLNPNGKLDRRALPVPEIKVGGAYTAPLDEVEEKLTVVWSEVLGIKKEKISADANFFALGGHSLNATILIAKIHKAFDTKIPLTEVFLLPTVRELARYIKDSVEEKHIAIPVAEEKEYYRLSSAQKRLYILQQMEPQSIGYNMPYVISLDMAVDKENLQETFKRLIHRHESLRTSFLVIDEEPVQKIHKDVEFQVKNYKAPEGHPSQIIKMIQNFICPFDLSQAPQLRVGLIQLAVEKYIFMMDMHHIITDGISQGIFVKEFMAVYNNSSVSLPPLRLQYKDYAHWQDGEQQAASLIRQEQYWLERFAGELPVLNLPYDYPRPAVQSFEGTHKIFFLDREETTALRALAANANVTLYMGLLAVFTLLLSRLSGQKDIIIGSPTAGRRHADLQSIMGIFVNTLAMRNYPEGERTVSSFLQEVKQGSLEAFENQEYPFETLVEKVSAARDVGRNPVFDVMFALQNLEELKKEPIDSIRPYEYENRIAKFDITLVAAERDNTIAFSLEYCTRLFREETIERFIDYFKNCVSAIVEDHHQKICAVEMLNETEKRQVLLDFNDTGEPYNNDKTIPQLFESQVERTPDHIALIGSVGEHLSYRTYMTYKKLNQTSHQLAHHLVERGVKKNEMVGLKSDRSVEMIIGILGILKAGCAYVPLNPKAPAARSKYILEECSARILVSKGSEDRGAAPISGLNKNIEVIDLMKIGPIGPIVREKSPPHLCYVIFTSGSTGKPKGVPISHANLCPLLHWGYRNLGLGTKDRFIQNLSYYFDWSVWEIMMAITTGASLHMVPDDLLLNPEACIPFMNQRNITVLHITPTQYQYFINVGCKLETLKYLFIGAEKLSCELVERSFESVNEDCRVFNMYGPTECTIISAVLEIERSDVEKFESLSSVPIGGPVGNIDLLVLDKYLNPCPVNVLGELYIGGDCVASGYLNQPELTAEKFVISHLSLVNGQSLLSLMTNDQCPMTIYRTGDLVRWLPSGPASGGPSMIEFLGRVDFQVKIRGFRIELGEIESRLLKHDLVEEAVVIDRQKEDGEKYLCAYIIPREVFDVTELKEYLSKHLPDYMIPSYFMKIESIPLNPNGKLDRRALPVPDVQVGEEYLAPSDESEEKLAVVWSEVLGVEKEKISTDANFFELGGHSLNATILIAKIHKAFDVKIPLTEVFILPTVKELARYIKAAAKDRYAAVEPVEKKGYYVLSSAQKRLYILQQMTPQSLVYNMAQVIQLNIVKDKEKLENIFRQLIARHESLRTSFLMVEGKPVQKIHNNVEFEIEGLAAPAFIKNFIRPFDLSQASLLRVGLIKIEEEKYLLLVDMHHIISDGISQGVLVKEFMAIHHNTPLPPLRLHYKDYAEWQNRKNQQEILKQQERYWLERLAGELPVLNLPYDYTRPELQSFDGSHKTFFIGSEKTAGLKALAASEEVTLYMVLLAAFNLLLTRLSGEEDIIVGSPVAGRRHEDLQEIIGMFVNTLAIRNYPSGEKDVLFFLQEVKQSTLEAFENQEYAFEDLVEKVSVARDVARNPVFDVMFALQNVAEQRDVLSTVPQPKPADKSQKYHYETSIAKFDITLVAVETNDHIAFSLEYCTKLFKEETIERFINYFKNLTASIADNPYQRLSDIQFITETEKRQILEDFNNTDTEYPTDKTIQQMFEEQAVKTADRIAVVPIKRHISITYSELIQKTNQLAYLLRDKGVKPGSIVAIMVERSLEMMIGIYGILKAGGAYLPVEPGYPEERIRYLLADSGAGILLSKVSAVSKVSRDIEVIELSKIIGPIGPIGPMLHGLPTDLCYIIYTSGSTGMPKGVMIEHTSVVNRLNWMQRAYPIDKNDVILQKTTYTFDVSVWELFWWSFQGARLCLLGPGEERDPSAIVDAVANYHVTTIHFVPSMLNIFLDYLESERMVSQLASLRQVFASGEALKKEQVDRFHRLLNPIQTKLMNLYGPTEATVDVSYFDCSDIELFEKVTIGKPIDNIKLVVVDKGFHLQPVGIAGELFISGVGVARGYLNRPELTAERFIGIHSSYISYRTGDLACWLPDGNIEFLGRIDHQVKVRGFRIELGEIEKCLVKSLPVKEAVVAARPDSTGDNQLVAYVVPDETCAFTVNRLIQIEKEGHHVNRLHYELPNGMPIFYLNRHETDFMYREIFEECSYLKHGITLREGACVFDIGANIGLFSLFTNNLSKNAEIYAFEPVPPLYELLKLNTSLYGNNFRVFKSGISSTQEEAVFTYYPHATLLSGRFADGMEEKETVKAFIEQELKELGDDRPSEDQIDELLQERLSGVQFPCSMKPLSQVIRENDVERIDLLKIDVEKSELDVLNGIDEQDWAKIQQLVIEVHDSENNGIVDQVKRMLKNHGYAVKVEQDSMLEETGLYNVYAVLPIQAQREEVEVSTTNAWYNPDQLVKDLREALKGHLPDYMVPAHFVLLDKLPLTMSGKIDGRALPDLAVKADKAYEAPVNEVEEKLVNIWCDVLGIEEEYISVTARFFELGGHSLKAAGMVSRINREFKVNVPLIQIFTTPTIRQLAAYLSGLEGENAVLEDNQLVRLRKGPDHGHLFLVHDGSGEVEGYIELCRRLTVDINCWGIRAQRFAGYAPHNLSIEEIAAAYIEKIKKIQSHGPYHIAGWSLGGTIAYEMVRQLEKDGEAVGYLLLIDSPPPQKNTVDTVFEFNRQSEVTWLSPYLADEAVKEKIAKQPDIKAIWSFMLDYLEGNDVDRDVIKKAIPGNLVRVIPNVDQLSIRQLVVYLNVIRSLDRARSAYLPPTKIKTPMHYVGASQSTWVKKEDWNQYTEAPVKFYQIRGDHFSILRMPQLKRFVRDFKNLEAVEED